MIACRRSQSQAHRVWIVVLTDLAVIGELFLAMYLAHARREQFTAVFAGVFFSFLIPTLALSKFLLRRLAPAEASGDHPEKVPPEGPMIQ